MSTTIGKKLCLVALSVAMSLTASAQDAGSVMKVMQKVNNRFMEHYADPTKPTFVKRERPSSLWTRAVYYEGLMALYELDPDQRYIDYTDRWANFHEWTPRNGVTTCDADDQCCGQTYLQRYMQVGGEEKIAKIKENLDYQMKAVNEKKMPKCNQPSVYGWWTWIDAIQMAMPVYVAMTKVTGDRKYLNHAMRMYTWSRDSLAGGLFNTEEGLWWRDADYVPPYKESDGANCYWSRGNGWVYATYVRVMDLLDPDDFCYELMKKDFMLMTDALLKCQREDGFWNVSLTSKTTYPGIELTGTALFLYGISWGINKGYLCCKAYKPICDKIWAAMVKECVHKDGFLGWVQGTGKDPSAGQPLAYDKMPDFEDYGTGCFLLGAAEYYKLLNKKPCSSTSCCK